MHSRIKPARLLVLRLIMTLSPLLFIYGCGPFYYPGIYGSQTPPVLVADEYGKHRAINIDVGNLEAYNDNETNRGIRVHYMLLGSGKFHNVNVGVFGNAGNYYVDAVEQYQGNKAYFGAGPFFNFNLQIPIRRLVMGAGIILFGGIEAGPYDGFMKNVDDKGLAICEYGPYLLVAIYPNIRMKLSTTATISLQLSYGLPGWLSPSLTLQHKKRYYWLSAFPFESDSKIGYSLKYFTFGYGFNF